MFWRIFVANSFFGQIHVNGRIFRPKITRWYALNISSWIIPNIIEYLCAFQIFHAFRTCEKSRILSPYLPKNTFFGYFIHEKAFTRFSSARKKTQKRLFASFEFFGGFLTTLFIGKSFFVARKYSRALGNFPICANTWLDCSIMHSKFQFKPR